jgi:hypothetical protein
VLMSILILGPEQLNAIIFIFNHWASGDRLDLTEIGRACPH